MIFSIFKKEMIDVLRDRRSLIASILVPLLIGPVLFVLIGVVATSARQKDRAKVVRVALSANGSERALRQMLLREGNLLLTEGKVVIRDEVSIQEGRRLIEADSLDMMIQFDPEFEAFRSAGMPGRITVYFRESGLPSDGRRRIEAVLAAYRDLIEVSQLDGSGLDPRVSGRPIEIVDLNLASTRERVSEIAGRLVPYIFIMFSFMGCMHPAIDLTAGEKERGTFETFLTLPVTRFQILFGKFIVVSIMGLVSSGILILSILGIATVTGGLQSLLRSIGGITTVIMLLSLLVPLVLLFSSSLMSASIYSRSYKEAQSYLGPAVIVVLAPVIVGLLPGVDLTNVTALVPILNISLAMKAIVAGRITAQHLLLIYGSLIALALLSLWLCAKMFERESAVFRS